jgi:hypothetical protein
MSWLQRVFLMMSNSALQPEVAMGSYANLTATLPANPLGKTDRPSRKTETLPAIPSEFVGLHGEYDPQGLAKRVAQAFDQHPQVQQIKTLCIIQHGSQITLLGKVADTVLLQQVVELAKQVEGTKEVNVEQVVIAS